ncbi:MAG: DUF86 domain-containing protein [Nanoarchaeota archaeon]
MKKEPKIFLEHILENIGCIESFSIGVTEDKLAQNQKTQYAIVRAIEIIGEAVKNLPKEFTEEHAEIPWKDIVGMRDKIIHQYFDIDLDIVWQVMTVDLPDLKKKITFLLKKT